MNPTRKMENFTTTAAVRPAGVVEYQIYTGVNRGTVESGYW
jgi:hypothetical protein